jgi:hypothetical protein
VSGQGSEQTGSLDTGEATWKTPRHPWNAARRPP